MRKALLYITSILGSWIILWVCNFTVIADHGTLIIADNYGQEFTQDLTLVGSKSTSDFSVGSEVTFHLRLGVTTFGTLKNPSPSCGNDEVELEGWVIRTADGEPVTDFIHFQASDRCIPPRDAKYVAFSWIWDTRDKNKRFARAGAYRVELVTAGNPPHDGVYSVVFNLLKKPDLTVLEEPVVTPAPNGAFLITAKIANLSAIAINNFFLVSFEVPCNLGSDLRTGSQLIHRMHAHEVKSVSTTLNLASCSNPLPPHAVVDPDSRIEESDEDNNDSFGLEPSLVSITNVIGPEPLLTIDSIASVPTAGTIVSTNLRILCSAVDSCFLNGLSSYKLKILLVGKAEITGINFAAFKGSARISRDKHSAILTAKDKHHTVPPGTEDAVLAQIIVRGKAEGSVSLQVVVMQLFDDNKDPMNYRTLGISFGVASSPSSSIINFYNLRQSETFIRVLSDFSTLKFISNWEEIEAIRVMAYDLAGKRVFDSNVIDRQAINSLRWELPGLSRGTRANGVYLYVVVAYNKNGTAPRTEIGKLVILRK